ncbi:hypothetical protein DZ956_030285, partial [Pseudomonas aeruginosa]|uniref:hypothetical protein n=1 Tax=Pseudomonas aeruginosa TaxID=287 RepID=UPI001F9596EB
AYSTWMSGVVLLTIVFYLGPDLSLILCGALLIRHAWMQARAAAPPAHPRVTGDHHA